MNFDKYLIVTDLDGTLFDEHQRVPQASLEALDYFKSNGGTFTFATGRDVMFIRRRFPFLIDLINAPAIMSNGSMVLDFATETRLVVKNLEKDLTNSILKKVNERFPDAPFQITLDGGFFVVNPDEYYYRRFNSMEDIVTYSDRFSGIDREMLAVNFIDRNIERLNKVAEFVGTLDKDNKFEKVFSDTFIYEMLPYAATKGEGLNFLRRNYSDKIVIAAGDWYNDISVLKNSDVPVCPINAAQEIKDFCKFILCHCNDGIISDIVHLIKNGLI